MRTFPKGLELCPGDIPAHTIQRNGERGQGGKRDRESKREGRKQKGGGRFRLESHVSLPRLMANRPSLRDSCSFKNEITGLRIAEAGEQISQTNQR